MDTEDIMDKEVREIVQALPDIDYMIEEKECCACVSHAIPTLQVPCDKCFDKCFSKPNFEQDDRNNIIDRITEENEG